MRSGLCLGAAALAVLLGLSTDAYAQSMEERLEQKLAKEFVKNAEWNLDYDAALAKAKTSKRPIFAYFTRSYSP